MSKKYQVLEHTGDLKIEAMGKTLAEAFENIALGMFLEMKPLWGKEEVERKIEVESPDSKALLVDFLNELVTQSDINQEAYQDFKVKIIGDKKLEADVKGKKIKNLELEIKAVTFSDLEIKKEDGSWKVAVVFDI